MKGENILTVQIKDNFIQRLGPDPHQLSCLFSDPVYTVGQTTTGFDKLVVRRFICSRQPLKLIIGHTAGQIAQGEEKQCSVVLLRG